MGLSALPYTRSTNLINYYTMFHVLGKGDDKNNLRNQYPTTAPTGISLRETFVKGADQKNGQQLYNLAFSRFRQQRQKIQAYDIEILQSSVWRYGRDYFLGDLVSVDANAAVPLTRKIYAVSLSMDSQGAEEVQIDLAAI